MRRAMLVSLLFLAAASPAAADVLLLTGGGRVEGVVTERGDVFLVKGLAGTAEIPKSRVASRVKAPYVTELYERRLARLDPTDADARVELAIWCREHDLRSRARENLEAAVRLDPDHERARGMLGQVRYRGTWMSPAEAREARMADAGLIRFQGRWFTEEGLAAFVKARRELADLEREQAEKRAAFEAAEEKRRAEEEKKAREAAEKKAREEALARAAEDRRARERLERENAELKELLREMIRRERDPGVGYWWVPGYRTPTVVVPRSPRVGTGVCAPRPFGPRLGLGVGGDGFDLRGWVR